MNAQKSHTSAKSATKNLTNTKLKNIKKLEFDLSTLFKNKSELDKLSIEIEANINNFCEKYQQKIATLKIEEIESAIKIYEDILEQISKIMLYAFLHFADDSLKYGKLYAECEMKCTKLHAQLVFFEIEISELENKKLDSLIEKSKRYGFYLEGLKDNKKYKLDVKEEKILMNLSPVGASAFSRLFDESLSNMRFNYIEKSTKECKKINLEQILSLMHHANRDIRKKAQITFTKSLKNNAHLLSYIINIVRKDLAIMKDLRGYDLPESFRHLENKTTQKSVDCLINCVNDNMNVVSRYYFLKGKLLNIDLKDYDRYAPIILENDESDEVDFSDALTLVLDSFKKFSPIFYDIAIKAIENGWISSHPGDNKRSGAFSHGAIPSSHPFVLLNYTGNRRDVFTIAHEFGHMIHQELSKSQGLLNMDTPLTTAETASVFAEMLLFDSIKDKISKNKLIEIYAGKIEDIFSTLFRQIVMTNFEREIHKKDGELDANELNKIWLKENQKMFGSSVKLSKNYALWWSYIPHFIHSPFYCYAYSYGQLLVLALFGLYKSSENREDFIDKYIKFLSSGGSKSPKDLISSFGFDIEDDNFWNIGMIEVKKMLDEFEKLLK